MLKNKNDLKEMREAVKASVAARENAGGVRLVVAMGTCGIASGAREVVAALMDELEQRGARDVTLTQSGCKGLCDREPTLDVLRMGEAPVTYGDVTPEAARRIVAEHVVGGEPVKDLVLYAGEAEGPRA